MKQNAMLWPLFLLGLLASSNLEEARTTRRWTYQEPRLGTQVRLTICSGQDPARAVAAAFSEIDRLNRIFSDYDETSEVMRLCQANVGESKHVSAELAAVLKYSQDLAAETEGAFDVTVGPYSQLWRRARRQRQLPTSEALAEAKTKVGFRLLKLNVERRTAKLERSGIRLDLGGIAKGAIADWVYQQLLASGFPYTMIAIGGDLRLGAPPPGEKGWRVATTSVSGSPVESLLIAQRAVSTSGDLEQFFEKDGKRYSHIIDPRTGWGVEGRRLVTVVAPTGMEADALATALSVLTINEGERLLEAKSGVAARWVEPGKHGPAIVHTSARWQMLPRVPEP